LKLAQGGCSVWTCPNQQAAVNATANTAAKAIYLGQFKTGIRYPTNANIDLCEDGAGECLFPGAIQANADL
jgi:hypothetical protein